MSVGELSIGELSGWELSGWELSGWELSVWGIGRRGIVRRGIVRSENCPGIVSGIGDMVLIKTMDGRKMEVSFGQKIFSQGKSSTFFYKEDLPEYILASEGEREDEYNWGGLQMERITNGEDYKWGGLQMGGLQMGGLQQRITNGRITNGEDYKWRGLQMERITNGRITTEDYKWEDYKR